jgi:hypothetical protein
VQPQHRDCAGYCELRLVTGLLVLLVAKLTENPAAAFLPVALAQAIAGAQAWQGMGLLSGSSITDIVTALTSFKVILFTVRSGQLGSFKFATTGGAWTNG